MSISSVKTGTIGDSLLAGNAFYDPAATFLIQRQTLTTSASTVTFSSIPSTYKHLQLRVMAQSTRGTYSDEWRLRVNGDTGANYAHHRLWGTGSSATASGGASATSVDPLMPSTDNATPDSFTVAIVDIHDYASTTKYKTIRAFGGNDTNYTASNNGVVVLHSSLWQNTAAITSLTFSLAVASYTTRSTFALYGMVG
jgi:hypothetical protein